MHGICAITLAPLRAEASDRSEMVSQLLFGDLYTVLEKRKNWLRIKMDFDGYEGWLGDKQHQALSNQEFQDHKTANQVCAADTVSMLASPELELHQMILEGSTLYPKAPNHITWLGTEIPFDGNVIEGIKGKDELLDIAFTYLNTPYVWGGRSPFGIDCSGFTQIVYKMCGHVLPRDAKDQALLGEALSFIEESEPGDLAFFDNAEGNITHVGIMLANNYIIHASGKVRLDRLDQHGIYNAEQRAHTHRLRVIKKIF
jgi:hypothetical protein